MDDRDDLDDTMGWCFWLWLVFLSVICSALFLVGVARFVGLLR